MPKVTLQIRQATVVTYNYTDTLTLELEVPSTFPMRGYPATARIELQEGYGAEWCKSVLGFEPEVIDVKALQKKVVPGEQVADPVLDAILSVKDYLKVKDTPGNSDKNLQRQLSSEQLEYIPDGTYERKLEDGTFVVQVTTTALRYGNKPSLRNGTVRRIA